MNVSLIITTYNWPEALRAVLLSVTRQAHLPSEVIVADDGSGPETARVVQETLGPTSLPWRHARHKDTGIRQARIKNLGVKASHGDYLIFVDHDVLLHPLFVRDHLVMARRGLFLQGKRCFMPEGFTQKVLDQGVFEIPSPFMKGLENRKNAIRSPGLGRFFTGSKGFQTSLRGCNLSMHREDFLKVDGYDETFDQLWGREDSDICYRLFHSGVKVRNLLFAALQYHLHHEVRKNRGKDRLDLELERIRKERRKVSLKGFSRLSEEGEVLQDWRETR